MGKFTEHVQDINHAIKTNPIENLDSSKYRAISMLKISTWAAA
jgi:hypothetical protein